MSYTVIITEEISANVDVTTQNYPITIEYNATNITPGSGYGNADVAAYLASGSLSSNVTTTGNVSGTFIIGNGSLLTNLPAGNYTNANVATFLAAFGSNTISTTGNITGGVFTGNASGMTAIPGANVTGTVANATYALNANAATFATNAVQANVANVANSVTGANVSGTVANATYALNSNAATFAGTVTTNAQPNITSVGNLSSLTVTGDAAIGGNLQVTGNVTYIASNVVTINDKFINVANNAATSSSANGGGIGVGPVGSEYATWSFSDANTAWQSNIRIEAPNVSATGNVTASNVVGTWLWGDGSNITGVVAGAASTRIEVKNTSGGPLTKGTPVYATGVVGASTVVEVAASRADTPSTLPCLGLLAQDLANNGQGYAITVGTLTSTNTNGYTTGQELYVAATGGLTASRPTLANTVQTVGIVGRVDPTNGSIEVNVWNVNSLPNLGNGNVWVGNATGFPTQQGVYGDANVAAYLPTYTGNLAAGNITVTGVYYGNGSGLTTLTAANVTGTVGLAQFVTQAAQANITSLGILTGLTVAGNAAVGNLLIVGNSATGTGNLQIATTGTANTFNPDASTTSVPVDGRIVIGSGSSGNLSLLNDPAIGGGMRGSRLLVYDRFVRNNQAYTTRAGTFWSAIDLTANVTQANARMQALSGMVAIGGGASANTFLPTATTTTPLSVSAGQFNAYIGNNAAANLALGNTTVSHAAVNGGVLTVAAGSTVGNAQGMYTFLVNSGTVNTQVGYSTGYGGGGTAPSTFYSFYHPGNTITVAGNVTNALRQATNYYAFFNEDDHAQMRLGSVRRMHEYRHDLATTGNVSIDKANGQVQYIRPTGNVTITGFSNFVTETYDGSTYDQQTDTVTIVIAQGATPYTITMPTGNTAIKYAAGINTVANTANAVTMISVTAANVASTRTYMVTISSEFT